jgi:hypothetical protein
MAIKTDIIANPSLVDYGKYAQLVNDTRFPSVSSYNGSTVLTEYPKYATLSYMVNASDISISLSAGNLDIGNVGVIDHSSGHEVVINVIETQTINGTPVGAALVKTLGTTPISGSITVLNPVSSFTLVNPVTAVTVLNPVSSFTLVNPITSVDIHTNQTIPISGGVTITQPVSTILIAPALPITFADGVQIDQASRLKVAIPKNQWWFIPSIDKDVDVRYQETATSGGSSFFVQNLASILLTSGTSSVSGSVIRASRRRHKVIPGSSHEWIGVTNFDGKQDNVIKRTGMFTNFNGYFFELSGSNFNVVVRRRLLDGTLVEERVEQANWNGDKLDGTGPSGENWNALTQTGLLTGWVSTTPVVISGDGNVYNVVYSLSAGTPVSNFRLGTKATVSGISPVTYNGVATIVATDSTTNRLTATYITPVSGTATVNGNARMYQTGYHMAHTLWFDFMGGRTNRVRFGKASDYGNIVLHTFRFDGLLGTSYENAPALMERREIRNYGIPSGIPSLTDMGASYTIEDAVDLNPNFCIARAETGITFDTVGQEYPILGIGLRAGEPYQRGDLQVQNLHVIDIANLDNNNNLAAIAWRLVLNPSIQGVIPASTNIGKATRKWEYTTSNTISGGIDLVGGYSVSKTIQDLSTALNFLNMGSNIEYTDADKVVLVCKLLNKGSANSNIVSTMNFIEAL